MSVLIATNAGAKLAIDVAIDANADRIAALSRHLGAPETWTVNAGSIMAMRDGAESLEFDVDVTGVFAGQVELSAPGSLIVAASRPLNLAANEKARVLFRVTRAHDRESTLAGAVPVTSTLKLGSAQMLGAAALGASAVKTNVVVAHLQGQAALIGIASHVWSAAAAMAGSGTLTAVAANENQASSSMAAGATVTASGTVV